MADLPTLLAQLTGGDDEAAERAAAALADRGSAAADALLDLLQANAGRSEKEVDTRWWALRALAGIPDARTVPTLLASLQDEEPAIRQCAALGLRKQPQPEAIPALVKTLEDSDSLCRTLAADSLVVIGAEAVPPLISTLESGPQAARLEAVRALAEIGDKRAIPILFKVLNEDSSLMEYWASQGLENMGLGLDFFKP
jgi:HEAT repeat protein